MVTLRREMTHDTRTSDYGARDNSVYRNDRLSYADADGMTTGRSTSKDYLNYLWSELDRTETRRTLRPEEYENEYISNDRAKEQDAAVYRAPAARRQVERAPVYSAKYSENRKLDKKGVVAIVAYFLIVAAIVAMIIATGSNASYEPSQVAGNVSIEAGAEVNSTAGLPLISKDALGVMILSDGSAADIDLLATGSAYAYEEETNWFDKLCDAISFIAGG